jgi:UDPglucose--hexose-1-phosphate uridylyltransferase
MTTETLITKTVTTLADGRELTYYDRGAGPARDYPDLRTPTPVQRSSRIRYDAAVGEWVIIASHRQDRSYHPPSDECPLCPTRDGHLTEVPAPDYDVVVFENRFPALTGAGPGGDGPVPPASILQSKPGTGRCEVICFSSDHDVSFRDLSDDRVRLILDVWTDRTQALSALPGVEQVFCFENRGAEIGVTQTHPHGQIYAYPFVTPRTSRMIASATGYRRRRGRNLFDDLVAAEISDGTRIVAENEAWIAFVPFAARWPYEVHLYPKLRHPDLVALGERERDRFAGIYLDLLRRFDGLFDTPAPYIAAWHQAPAHGAGRDMALHLQLFTNRRTSSKLKYLAGSESGMDVFANDISPEQAARRLRTVEPVVPVQRS